MSRSPRVLCNQYSPHRVGNVLKGQNNRHYVVSHFGKWWKADETDAESGCCFGLIIEMDDMLHYAYLRPASEAEIEAAGDVRRAIVDGVEHLA